MKTNKIISNLKKIDWHILNGDISTILMITYENESLEFKKFLKNLSNDINAELKLRDLTIKLLEKRLKETRNK